MRLVSLVPAMLSALFRRPEAVGWFVRIGSVMLLLALIGSVYQRIGTSKDSRSFPPPGRLVAVDGYRLHLYCVGDGSPTVVLEAGSGNKGVVAWSLVQRRMASTTRVCSYDRAGMGWSDPDPAGTPRYSPQVAEALHTLLRNANVRAPYVLVGHSAGGIHVRNFAYQYPDDVAGMVLLDAAPDNTYLTLMPVNPTEDFFDILGWKYCHLLTALGVTRLVGESKVGSLIGLPSSERGRYPLPDSIYQSHLANKNRTHYCRSAELEFRANRVDGSRSDPPRSLGALPLLVVTAGSDTAWNAMQRTMASLSTDSEQQLIADGDHFLQLYQPDAVIAAVDRMVTKVRSAPPRRSMP